MITLMIQFAIYLRAEPGSISRIQSQHEYKQKPRITTQGKTYKKQQTKQWEQIQLRI
jgi:hypothetical protein